MGKMSQLAYDLSHAGMTASRLDQSRLTGQLRRVYDLMSDGEWRTLAQIAQLIGGSEAGVSARLRDLRKPHCGRLAVLRIKLSNGLWAYKLVQ